MSPATTSSTLDRHAEIGALSTMARKAVMRLILPSCVVIAFAVLYLTFTGQPGAKALVLIGGGTCLALVIWNSRAIGLPLLPMMAIQSLLIYGMPIVAAHDNIKGYPADFVITAGMEVLVFNVTMAVSWWMCMNVMQPARAVSYALQDFNRAGAAGLTRLGFSMLGAATLFEVLQGLNLLNALYQVLPSGSDSILQTLVAVASACGLFLLSMVIGGNEASPLQRFSFVALLIMNTMIAADGFLLAAPAANLITVAIGLFWGGGKIPWRYLTLALLSLSFLNIGKTTMRDRYWGNEEQPAVNITMDKLPGIFAEWSQASYDAILENNAEPVKGLAGNSDQTVKNQTLLDRIDNLQNLLFVIDAIDTEHVKPLHGATYALIPPLLVPRVFWPDKPRSHEGQILLNVHFGRQDYDSTLVTYIAWGLLPEAYGNFGPIMGSIVLAVFLGVTFAWVENFSARKLVVSMEGFLCLCLLLSLMNSFEMVASVLVTSTFQSMVVIVAACYPFVSRTAGDKPTHEDE
jgi:hypothetical protein